MKNNKKVLVYNHAFFLISETFIYQQASGLAKNYDVHLLSGEFKNPHGFDVNMFKQHVITKPESVFQRAYGKWIRKKHQARLNLDRASFLKLKKLLTDEDLVAIHAHFGDNAIKILGYARAFSIPLVASFHGHDASGMLKDKRYAEKLPELFEYATAITISSKHMFENLKLEPWKDKVHVIPYGINAEDFRIESKQSQNGTVKILHSGRVVPTKGVPDLIHVFDELAGTYKNIELHIAGDGRELDKSKKLASRSPHSGRITFYGRVSQGEVKKLFSEADIFVLNSRTDEKGDMEGTPVTNLEAMCAGKAVVSTIHAGIPDVIQHGENGLLANEYANNELKDCIEKLITNPDLRKKLGENAKSTIEKKYTNRVMQEKINRIFEEISNNRQS